MLKRRVAAIFLVLCFLLGACAKSGQDVSPEQEQESDLNAEATKTEWVLEGTALPDPEEALSDTVPVDAVISVLDMKLVGETVYRYSRQYGEQMEVTAYYIQKLGTPYVEWETKVIDLGDESVSSHTEHLMTIAEDGELCYLYEEEGAYYLERLSYENGHSLQRLDSEDLKGLLAGANGWYIWKGKNYIHTLDGLYCFSKNFDSSEKIGGRKTLGIMEMAEDKSGEMLYLWGPSEEGSGYHMWRYTENDPIVEGDIFSPGNLAFSSDAEAYLCDVYNIWHFELESGEAEQLDAYRDWGYYLKNVYGAYVREDGTLLILAQEKSEGDGGEGLLLLERKEKEESDKIRLELATDYANTFLKESVVRFNQQNEQYEIVLRERPNDAEPGEAALQEWEDYCTRIQAEMSAGGGPDLIDTNILSIEDGAAKGYLRDLTEDFADQREVCVQSIWQNSMVDEKLYAVPFMFSLNTLVVPDKTVGDRTSWTLEELIQITRESGVKAFAERMDSLNLFWNLGIMAENNSQLIDWENKACRLNGPEAVQLLEFSKEYGFSWELLNDPEKSSSGDWVVAEEALTEIVYFFDMSSIQHCETCFKVCDSEPVFIGFPTESGEAVHIMQVDDFAVNQSCQSPEGAVAFLRFMQSEERQNRLMECMEDLVSGYPVRQASLELLFDQVTRGEYEFSAWTTEVLGEEVEAEPISQETFQEFIQIIETARPRSRRAEAVFDIMADELQSYYSGEKSAQEALDILQNRVQLYLNEMD